MKNGETGSKEPENNSESKSQGLCCPVCGCYDLRVVYVRPTADGAIRRRRQCRNCGKRISTREKM